MKKNKLSNRTIALIAAAMVLFAGGAFTGTQAVLNIFSPEHFLEFETDIQDVMILENGVDTQTLLGHKVVPGTTYKEELSAKNTTSGKKKADQFVRVIVRKYWVDKTGKKMTAFEKDEKGNYPDMDKIELAPANTDLWQINGEETTAERTVYYYKNIVKPGEETKPLTSTLKLDGDLAKEGKPVQSKDNPNVIVYEYEYDGYHVFLEAEAQSIQTHNVTGTKPGELNAIKSIWGVDNVTSDGKTLKVN